MRTKPVITSIAVLVLALWSATLYAAEQQARSTKWAQPITTDQLQNFYKLDDKVYRSEQPDRKGFGYLKSFGIRNVLNLRDHHKDDAKAKGSGLTLYRVEMRAGKITTDEVVAALRIIKRAEGPIVVHCWHGSDRTGTVSALYRIIFQNWSKEEAVEELMNGGYGYHAMYKNIPAFIRSADIDDIKRRVFAQ
jgi:protein tyrosine/serine phosphatase